MLQEKRAQLEDLQVQRVRRLTYEPQLIPFMMFYRASIPSFPPRCILPPRSKQQPRQSCQPRRPVCTFPFRSCSPSRTPAPADLSKRQAELQYAMQELLGGQAMFERLGLRFDAQVGENVRVIFTQIDPAAPGREFVVGVSVNDADDFELRECTPAIPDMPQLLDEVNQTADFSKFVQRCRAHFKGMCATAGASSS